MSKNSFLVGGLLLAGFGLVGCGNGTIPVKGKVVWEDGRPAGDLAGSRVMFQSSGSKYSPHGLVGDDGSFVMSTHSQNDGVLAGPHQAYVVEHRKLASDIAGKPDDDAREVFSPAVLDPKFGDPDTSGLTVDVDSSGQEVVLAVSHAKGAAPKSRKK